MGTSVVNGVTYVNASGPVRFADIAAAFGNDVNQASELRNRKWYKSDFSRGNFPGSGNLSLSSLRGTGGSLPRVNRADWPAVGRFFSSGNITLPPGFNKVSFRVYGAGGGGGGSNAAHTGGPFNGVPIAGGAGSTGGTTSVTAGGTTYSATGGGGGSNGSTGANGTPDPGAATDFIAGGAGSGPGGKGGRNFTTPIDADANYAAASALFGATCSTTYGAGGSGGGPGLGLVWTGAQYVFSGVNGTAGSAGGSGGISVMIDEGLY